MLPKKNRLDKKLFELVLQKGKFVNSPNLSLKFLKEKNLILPRISFVVPKTITKSAVKRNFLRRRGYSILNKYINNIPNTLMGIVFFGKNSFEIFSGKKDKKNDSIKNLENEIKYIVSKIN